MHTDTTVSLKPNFVSSLLFVLYFLNLHIFQSLLKFWIFTMKIPDIFLISKAVFSLYAMIKMSKTTSPPKLIAPHCICFCPDYRQFISCLSNPRRIMKTADKHLLLALLNLMLVFGICQRGAIYKKKIGIANTNLINRVCTMYNVHITEMQRHILFEAFA